MSYSLSTEDKAWLFDRLCDVLSDGRFVRYREYPIVDTSGRGLGGTVYNQPKYRSVPEYEHVLLTEKRNFREAMIDMLKRRPK